MQQLHFRAIIKFPDVQDTVFELTYGYLGLPDPSALGSIFLFGLGGYDRQQGKIVVLIPSVLTAIGKKYPQIAQFKDKWRNYVGFSFDDDPKKYWELKTDVFRLLNDFPAEDVAYNTVKPENYKNIIFSSKTVEDFLDGKPVQWD